MNILRILIILIPFAYVIWHFWNMVPFGTLGKWAVAAAAVLLIAIFFVAMMPVCDRLPMWLASLCYNVGSASVVIYLYSFLAFLVIDLLRLVRVLPHGIVTDSLLATVAWVGVLAVIFIAGGIHYHHKVRVAVEADSQGRVAREVKIVAVSDLHVGYHNRRAELARWVDIINAEHPDLVLVGGDIIDRSIRPLEEERMYEEFRRLEAPVYACLGNHEYYASEPRAEQFYRQSGIHLLIDSVATVGSIDIIGRDDRTNPHRQSLAALAARTDSSHYRIVLDHQPYHLEEAEQAGIDFQFSGHTHRGQLWPISWAVDAMYECAWGSHRRGATQYYVSSGLGIWGPKVRTGCQSEYVVITIRK